MRGFFMLLGVAAVIGVICYCCGVPYSTFATICIILGVLGGLFIRLR
jgi:hypothetical protein